MGDKLSYGELTRAYMTLQRERDVLAAECHSSRMEVERLQETRRKLHETAKHYRHRIIILSKQLTATSKQLSKLTSK